ncbi:hypothetical protein IMZ29_01860 [Achromobacter sp. GG226]|uniref:hypothetical protein n=1 Tax=Verticiella alkaliphila TaxID=2779529 RepID=UPI001C0BBD21|nr:hypothetical protein [Verticiella sp. GG226]MBU4609338.1 hypothetical protein [Verticiella sp. GG226]
MNTLSRLLRSVVVLMLALAGIAMAFVLMVSTAIALGVMYVVARVRGKPFPAAAMWQARRGTQWRFVRRPGAAPADAADEVSEPARPRAAIRRNRNVTDVEARDLP